MRGSSTTEFIPDVLFPYWVRDKVNAQVSVSGAGNGLTVESGPRYHNNWEKELSRRNAQRRKDALFKVRNLYSAPNAEDVLKDRQDIVHLLLKLHEYRLRAFPHLQFSLYITEGKFHIKTNPELTEYQKDLLRSGKELRATMSTDDCRLLDSDIIFDGLD